MQYFVSPVFFSELSKFHSPNVYKKELSCMLFHLQISKHCVRKGETSQNMVKYFCLRIVWAPKIKGIEYETIFEDLSNKSPSLLHYNPVHKKVPILIHNGKPFVESLVILEYIDETWKETSLLSEDLYERAMARFWAKFGDDKVVLAPWLKLNWKRLHI